MLEADLSGFVLASVESTNTGSGEGGRWEERERDGSLNGLQGEDDSKEGCGVEEVFSGEAACV